jgi:hypothetical protein
MGSAMSPATVKRYRVPRTILAESARALRDISAGKKESVVLWQGRVVKRDAADVRALVIPQQIAGALHFIVPLEDRLRLIDVVSAAGDIILAQLHTHPHEAFHSAADDRLAIPQHVGGISIVVPDWGRDWDGDLRTTAVYRCLGGGQWEAISIRAVTQLLEVT